MTRVNDRALEPAGRRTYHLTQPEREQLAPLWPLISAEQQPKLAYWRSALADRYAPATIRSKISDWRHFARWFREQPNAVFIDMVGPDDLIRYFDAHPELAKNTLNRRHISLVQLFEILGHPDNPAKALELEAHLAKIRRDKKHGPPRGQVEPLGWDRVQQIVAALDPDDSPRDERARLALGLMYDGLLRRSEVTQLRVRDLKPARNTRLGEADAGVLVGRSKTDQEGEGVALYCSQRTAEWAVAWIERLGLGPEHYLLCSLDDAGQLVPSTDRPLPDKEVATLLRRAAKQGGLEPDEVERIAGHSPRVGAAQDMAEKGKTLLQIQIAGRWKSEATVYRYVEKIMLKRGAMAEMARGQGRSPELNSPGNGGTFSAMNIEKINHTLDVLGAARRQRPDISVEEIQILLHLARTGREVTLGHLVQQLDLVPSRTSKAINSLQGGKSASSEERLVESRFPDDDLSTKLVQLTDAGKGFVDEMAGA